jgi:hypothetical protein
VLAFIASCLPCSRESACERMELWKTTIQVRMAKLCNAERGLDASCILIVREVADAVCFPNSLARTSSGARRHSFFPPKLDF